MIMLRHLALASVAALIAMTASVKAMDTFDLAGRAGFLIGAARYCGVSTTRAAHVRQWIAANLVATAETRQVVYRFDGFIDAASSAAGDGEFTVRCGAITGAFATLEHHITRSSGTRRTPPTSSEGPRPTPKKACGSIGRVPSRQIARACA
jgi:hypothetical protein